MQIHVEELMRTSGVKFGTSGARGLAADMTDRVCYTYTRAFLHYLEEQGELAPGEGEVALAGDLRPSTERIVAAVARAVADAGYTPVACGQLPSPAVALYGLRRGIPAIMVTGSHIPADRNGIKFNRASGEILKADEAGIRAQKITLDAAQFAATGAFRAPAGTPGRTNAAAREEYVARYLDFFPPECLRGQTVGVYQHSAVGRDLLGEILEGLGAEVVALARSHEFVPVDTEAIRPEDVELARQWAADGRFDAIVSTDGDSDRPLLADEGGQWLRGDVLGVLCARFLGADSVSTPVSCNTVVERCGWFASVQRTRIGSPYVIESMLASSRGGARTVVGYEANGGFLTQSSVARQGRNLPPLPTRDAVLPLLSILQLAAQRGCAVSALVAELPARFTASDRLQDFPRELSQAILARFAPGDGEGARREAEALFGELCGTLASLDYTDGVRMTFANGEVVHLRPSGNAPEFRCYNEADSEARVAELNAACMALLAGLR